MKPRIDSIQNLNSYWSAGHNPMFPAYFRRPWAGIRRRREGRWCWVTPSHRHLRARGTQTGRSRTWGCTEWRGLSWSREVFDGGTAWTSTQSICHQWTPRANKSPWKFNLMFNICFVLFYFIHLFRIEMNNIHLHDEQNIINEIFVMRLSKQTQQNRIAADYIDLKSLVLNSFLKAEKVNLKSFIIVDRLFQAAGPATENPRLPIVTVFANGMRRSPAAADRRWERPSRDEMGTQRSCKYIGAVL